MGLDNTTKVIRNIEINLGLRDANYMESIFGGLSQIKGIHNFSVEKTNKGQQGDIFVNNELVAIIDYSDFARLWTAVPKDHTYKIIFKYQYDPHIEASYDDKVVSAGYFTTIQELLNDITFGMRDIDVTARMRDYQGHPERKNRLWCIARSKIVGVAEQLNKEGYTTLIGKIRLADYVRELGRCKIGYSWRGIGHLCFRLIEYLQCGIVILSNDIHEYPLREDVYLKHEETAIFCETAEQFYKETKLLLKDKDKLKKIDSNALELWKEKLCPEKMGEWYYDKLREVL